MQEEGKAVHFLHPRRKRCLHGGRDIEFCMPHIFRGFISLSLGEIRFFRLKQLERHLFQVPAEIFNGTINEL